MIALVVVYLVIGLLFTMWADKKARTLYGTGCPSIKAGLWTSVVWLPLVLTAIYQLMNRR